MDITVSIARIELTRSLPICAASFKQARAFRVQNSQRIAGNAFNPEERRGNDRVVNSHARIDRRAKGDRRGITDAR